MSDILFGRPVIGGPPSVCRHEKKQLVWTTDAAARRIFRYQCLICGRLSTEQVRHALAAPDTPEVDHELRRRELGPLDKWRQEHAEERERECAERRQRYAEYLQSDGWKERRRLVLERAGGLCEGCREEPATEVHHLTYDQVGHEFLWELVAICHWCHERFHKVFHD